LKNWYVKPSEDRPVFGSARLQRYDVPLAETTTSSLEALKAYSLGMKALREKGEATAIGGKGLHRGRCEKYGGAFCSLRVADPVVLIRGGEKNAKPVAGAGYAGADLGGNPIPKHNRQLHVEQRMLTSCSLAKKSTVMANEPHHAGGTF
jgi:hypothetical protein